MRKILIFFLSNFCLYSMCQEIKLPDNFIECAIPVVESEEWYTLNHSKDSYSVKSDNGKLIIEKTDRYKKNAKLQLNNGSLVGENNGEWGGMLYFYPRDINKKNIEIKSGNIVDIIKFQNKIYFTEGFYIWGDLFELKVNNDSFTYERVAKFDDQVAAISIKSDNKIYIASHQNFYKIENQKVIKMFDKQFWRDLYPNSIAVFDEENVFLGIRSGVVKLNLKNKSVSFYREK